MLMTLKAFGLVLFAVTISAFAADPSQENDESEEWLRPRFLSPDGRYALLVTEDSRRRFRKGPGGINRIGEEARPGPVKRGRRPVECWDEGEIGLVHRFANVSPLTPVGSEARRPVFSCARAMASRK